MVYLKNRKLLMEKVSYSCVNLGSIKGFNELLYNENNEFSEPSSKILKLNKIDYKTKNNEDYKIIKYDKTILNNANVNPSGTATTTNKQMLTA
jgi:hypothetical protein